MHTLEQQSNKQSNLQTLEADFSLTKQELEEFKKLPKKEQEKQKQEKLTKLSELHTKLDQAIQEAIKTGELEEAKKLKKELESEIKDLEQEINITERLKLPEGAILMKIIPDLEITSASTAIKKLEAEGYEITVSAKKMLKKVNWKEPLNDNYEIVSISVRELFHDTENHQYNNIKAKAKEYSLDIVPVALTPEICLNYDKRGKMTILAMDTIPGFKFLSFGFGSDNSKLILDSIFGVEINGGSDETRYLFVRN